MWIYNSIYFLSLFNFLFFYKNKNKKLEKIVNSLMIILLIFFSGLRYEIGADYENYVNIFERVPALKFPVDFSLYLEIHGEKGYLLLNSLIKTLGFDYKIIFLLMSIFTLVFLYKALKNSPYLSMSIYIYISSFFLRETMGQIRYGLSSIICFYSLKYIDENKKIYYFLISIAFFIQGVAIIFFLLPLIKYYLNKKNFKIKILVFIIFIIFGIIIDRNFYLNIIYFFSENMGNRLAYSIYTEKVKFSLYQGYIILSTLILLIFLNKIKKNKIFIIRYINLYFLGTILYFILFNFAIYAGRFLDLFYKINLLLYPFILKEIENRKVRYFFIIFLIIFHSYLFFKLLFINKELFIPYKNWLL